MAANVHADGAVAGGASFAGEEAVFLLQVAKSRDHHHQRPVADVGVGKTALGAGEEAGGRDGGGGGSAFEARGWFRARACMDLLPFEYLI